MDDSNDWRRTNQESHLKGVVLVWKKYRQWDETWDHDHCEFCGAKFMDAGEGVLTEGYATEDEYRWICRSCFDDFKDEFQWVIKSDNEG